MLVVILSALLPVVVTLFLGYFAAWRHDFGAGEATTLNRMVMNYALPLGLFAGTMAIPPAELFADVPLVDGRAGNVVDPVLRQPAGPAQPWRFHLAHCMSGCILLPPRALSFRSIWGDCMRDRLLAALLALALFAPASAFAQSWLYEVRGGVLAHDIPIVAAGRYESSVSLNAELAFTPSLPLFGGAIRPVFGGSFTPNGQTSWVYLDAR